MPVDVFDAQKFRANCRENDIQLEEYVDVGNSDVIERHVATLSNALFIPDMGGCITARAQDKETAICKLASMLRGKPLSVTQKIAKPVIPWDAPVHDYKCIKPHTIPTDIAASEWLNLWDWQEEHFKNCPVQQWLAKSSKERAKLSKPSMLRGLQYLKFAYTGIGVAVEYTCECGATVDISDVSLW